MRSTLFATTAVLALAFATAAQAQHQDSYPSDRDDGYQDRYDQDDRDRYGRDRYDQDRYDDRYRGGSRSERVAAIAHEIENTAAAMHREYERNNRRPNRNEAQVAAALHELHEQADRFHRQVESYRRDPRHTARGYDGLLRAFDAVAYSLDTIRPRPYVDRGMDRIWSLTSELERYYGRRGRRDHQGRGYGSHGRYGYDRH